MWINQLNIEKCRSLRNVTLKLSQNLNIVIGDNASGKTSLLESLYLLSCGRSFRTPHISDVITYNNKEILVTAKTINEDITSHIGIEKSSSKTKIRINQQDIFSQAALSRYLPITVIHPDSIQLITGAPSLRRAYIDWIVFYLYPEFHSKWKAYQHILKQRNLCLKNASHRGSLEKWTVELIKLQPDISQFRKLAIERLVPLLKISSSRLLFGKDIDIVLSTGFPADINLSFNSLMEYYQSKLEYDLRVQRTSAGVHKANLRFQIDSKPAEKTASRGQLKLLSIALLLSQSAAIEKSQQRIGVLLIDDFTSELDTNNEKALIKYLLTLKQQIIITSTREELINADLKGKMFHVEHGEIKEIKTRE